MAQYDRQTQHLSWNYANDGSSLDVVGILHNRAGGDIYITKTGGFSWFGTFDSFGPTNNAVSGAVCVQLDTEPNTSNTIRFITTLSDNIGLSQEVAIRGRYSNIKTPRSPNQVNCIVSGSNWNAGNYSAAENRSRSHQFAVRTDHIDFEVMVVGSNSRMEVISFETKGQGLKRRTF